MKKVKVAKFLIFPICLLISLVNLCQAGISDTTAPKPVDTTHYYYDTDTVLVQYIVNNKTGETGTHWAKRVIKSKMDWVAPTQQELANKDQVTLHKQKTAIEQEYFITNENTKKSIRIIPINDYGLTPKVYETAIKNLESK